MSTIKGNAIVGQSGGPTAVMNASLMGVIDACLKNRGEIGRLYGAVNGIEGILREEIVDLFSEEPERIRMLRETPGAALGGCRYRLESDNPNEPDLKKIFAIFKKYDIRHFFYIGGNDSMDTAMKIDSAARKLGLNLCIVGIPKTIDNDLMETDHSPGYGSCARYLITSVIESGLHARGMKTAEPVTILVTVGRNAGWLPAACGLAKQEASDPPHILLFPEVVFDREIFAQNVRKAYEQYGFVYIVTGEGLKDGFGQYVRAESDVLSTDAFGHPTLGGVAEALQQMVEQDVRLKARVIKPDICQQAAAHLASGVDLDEAEECGRTAVRMALNGQSGYMVAIRRQVSAPYRAVFDRAPLFKIANIDRTVPLEFIGADGISVTEAFKSYLAPLLAGAPSSDSKNILRFYHGLKLQKVLASELR